MSAEFVDTNIFVYAYDTTAGKKHELARSLIENLWQSQNGIISLQVLAELYVVLTRKIKAPLPAIEACNIINNLSTWQVHEPARENLTAAMNHCTTYTISLWDAMIIESAAAMGCACIWSEDLNHKQKYAGVIVKNPFV